MVFVQWVPSKTPPKDKMQYALWANTLKDVLSGISTRIQGGNHEELSREVLMERIAKFNKNEAE